jgi:hypothetical protein
MSKQKMTPGIAVTLILFLSALVLFNYWAISYHSMSPRGVVIGEVVDNYEHIGRKRTVRHITVKVPEDLDSYTISNGVGAFEIGEYPIGSTIELTKHQDVFGSTDYSLIGFTPNSIWVAIPAYIIDGVVALIILIFVLSPKRNYVAK